MVYYLRVYLFIVVFLICVNLTAKSAIAEGLNGVWLSSEGDYLVLMQSANDSTIIGLQVETNFSSAKVFLGEINSSNLALTSLGGESVITAVVSTDLSGTLVVGETRSVFSAELFLAYTGSSYDGIWLSSLGHYLFQLTLDVEDAALSVIFDVTLSDMNHSEADISLFTGRGGSETISATMISDLNRTLQLNFSSDQTLDGSYITLTRSPENTPFTGTLAIPI